MNDIEDRVEAIPADRMASLGRALHEQSRFASPLREPLETQWSKAAATLPNSRARAAALKEIEPIIAVPHGSGGAASPAISAGSSEPRGIVAELQGAKASLENRLGGETEKRAALERDLQKERDDHRQAVTTLELQRKQLAELRGQCDELRNSRDALDSALRLKENEKDKFANDLQNLQRTRQAVSEQTTSQQGRINELERELEKLRDELSRALQERDAIANQARSDAATVDAQSADAAFGEIWSAMRRSLPNVFAETHVPNRKTFDRLAEIFVYLLNVNFGLEATAIDRLGEVRNVADPTDRCNTLHNQLQKTPALPVMLREVLASGKNESGFRQRLKVVYKVTCALPVGLRNVIFRSNESIQARLDVSKWGLGGNPGDGAVGSHYRKNVQRDAPDEILGELRKSMGKEVYEIFDGLMRQ